LHFLFLQETYICVFLMRYVFPFFLAERTALGDENFYWVGIFSCYVSRATKVNIHDWWVRIQKTPQISLSLPTMLKRMEKKKKYLMRYPTCWIARKIVYKEIQFFIRHSYLLQHKTWIWSKIFFPIFWYTKTSLQDKTQSIAVEFFTITQSISHLFESHFLSYR